MMAATGGEAGGATNNEQAEDGGDGAVTNTVVTRGEVDGNEYF